MNCMDVQIYTIISRNYIGWPWPTKNRFASKGVGCTVESTWAAEEPHSWPLSSGFGQRGTQSAEAARTLGSVCQVMSCTDPMSPKPHKSQFL